MHADSVRVGAGAGCDVGMDGTSAGRYGGVGMIGKIRALILKTAIVNPLNDQEIQMQCRKCGKHSWVQVGTVAMMAWFPEFETPEYQAHLEKKIEDEARSWNEYCEERISMQGREGRRWR
jgi:hypothetical protein